MIYICYLLHKGYRLQKGYYAHKRKLFNVNNGHPRYAGYRGREVEIGFDYHSYFRKKEIQRADERGGHFSADTFKGVVRNADEWSRYQNCQGYPTRDGGI